MPDRRRVVLTALALVAALAALPTPASAIDLAYRIAGSGPQPTQPIEPQQVDPAILSQSAVMIAGVPTSSWTYGCSATSAGMLFGYYDRTGYSNMYAGPANGGVAPLADLGNQCSIIATKDGFDGRTGRGHVDDYWKGTGQGGPDPFEGNWTEHTWGDCTADHMGTSQWKWDWDGDTTIDANFDGGTTFFLDRDGGRVYDYQPPASAGLPRTEGCHGMRLFAESRGYTVLENYTQVIDAAAETPGLGFTFTDFMAEIDAGAPLLVQVDGHTMLGVGYDAAADTIYLHDTWGDYVASMTWGGSYSGMEQWGVSVIHLEAIPEPATLGLMILGLATLLRRRKSA